jgi:hypothetical protein
VDLRRTLAGVQTRGQGFESDPPFSVKGAHEVQNAAKGEPRDADGVFAMAKGIMIVPAATDTALAAGAPPAWSMISSPSDQATEMRACRVCIM